MKKTALREISVFLAFAFILPLIFVLLIKYVPAFGEGPSNFILFGIEAAAPTVSAIISVLIFGRGLKKFFYNKYINNFSLFYTMLAFFFPLFIYFGSKAVSVLLFGGNLTGFLSFKKLIIVFWALIAEELGWRGFLEERLEKVCGSFLTPLILGVIWAAWHYHYFISGTMNVPLMLFILGCIFDSFGYYVLTRLSNGNIVPASIMHFSGNLFINLFLINPDVNLGNTVPYLIFIIFSFVYVIIFLIFKYKKAFSRN